MKYVRRGLAIAGLTCVVLVTVGGLYVWRTWDAVWDIPLPDIHASSDPAIIARGEYLVNGPSHCITCHAESEAVAVRGLENGEKVPLRGGQRFADATLGEMFSRNLTPDTETGIGHYSDGQVARLLRYAVKPDGRSTLQSLMPYGDMSDEDLAAIVSFLRAQPPVRNQIPPVQLPEVDRALWFKPPNLTPMDGSAFSKFPDRATFIARVQRGGRHYPGSPMPWESISRLTTEDAGAIYEYLRNLTPVPGRIGEPTFRKEG